MNIGTLRESRESGLSVVELVVASSILFIVAVSIFGVLGYAANASAMSDQRGDALNLANQKLEEARNLPYDNVGTYTSTEWGDPPGSIPEILVVSDMVVTSNVEWVRDEASGRALYKHVSVSVSWETPGHGSVGLSTYIYGKSELVNVGDVLIRIVDMDTGDPVHNGRVVLAVGAGSPLTVYSDNDGEAFFGNISVGDAPLTVDVFGKIVDASTPDVVSVAVEALTTIIVYVTDPAEAEVVVTDTAGLPVAGADVSLTDPGGGVSAQLTDGTGSTTFTMLTLGAYDVHIEAAGYTHADASFSVSVGGESVLVEVVLAVPSQFLVTVMDINGTPLTDATVRVYGPDPSAVEVDGSPAVTVASGEAGFNVAPGTYTVEVDATGYDPGTSVVVVPVEGVSEDFYLQVQTVTEGNLHIHVVDRRGRDVANRTIMVWGPNGYYALPRTNGNGDVWLYDLQPGTYTVRARRNVKTVEVVPGSESYLEIVRR